MLGKIPRAAQPKDQSTQEWRGDETILLVEDEDSLRDLAARILAKQGYTVLEAGTGPDALRILDEHESQVDLLVTDVVMPAMDGRELAEKVRERAPSIGVLFISGYTEDAIGHRGVASAHVAFLQKPYLPNALARKVRDVLQQRAAAAIRLGPGLASKKAWHSNLAI